MIPNTSSPSTPSQPQKAAQARALLHALLLAGMDPKATHPTPTTTTTGPTTHPTTAPSPPPKPKPSTATTTIHPQTQHHQPPRQTLTLDTSTRITGHGNAVTVPTSQAISSELILAALAKGCNVEIRTGVTVFGCRNAVAVAAGMPVGGQGVGGKRKRNGEDVDDEKRGEVKKEKVEN